MLDVSNSLRSHNCFPLRKHFFHCFVLILVDVTWKSYYAHEWSYQKTVCGIVITFLFFFQLGQLELLYDKQWFSCIILKNTRQKHYISHFHELFKSFENCKTYKSEYLKWRIGDLVVPVSPKIKVKIKIQNLKKANSGGFHYNITIQSVLLSFLWLLYMTFYDFHLICMVVSPSKLLNFIDSLDERKWISCKNLARLVQKCSSFIDLTG